jgi:hypothetical protein
VIDQQRQRETADVPFAGGQGKARFQIQMFSFHGQFSLQVALYRPVGYATTIQ